MLISSLVFIITFKFIFFSLQNLGVLIRNIDRIAKLCRFVQIVSFRLKTVLLNDINNDYYYYCYYYFFYFSFWSFHKLLLSIIIIIIIIVVIIIITNNDHLILIPSFIFLKQFEDMTVLLCTSF